MTVTKKINQISILRGIVALRWVLLFGLVIFELFNLTKDPSLSFSESNLVYLLLLLFAVINAGYYVYLVRVKNIKLRDLETVKFLQVVLDPILFTLLVYYGGGVATHAHSLYFLSIIIASILYSSRAVLSVILYCSLLYLGVILATHFGYVPTIDTIATTGFGFQGSLLVELVISFKVIFIMWVAGLLTIYFVGLLHQREDQLMEAQEQNKVVIENLPDGLIMYDSDLRIIVVNKSTEELFQIKRRKLEGENIRTLKSKPELQPFFKLALSFANKGKKIIAKEITVKSKKTSFMVIQTSIIPLFHTVGGILGYVQIFRDVSREKAIDEMKSEFISIAAHQLRTPLSVLKWVLGMVIKGDLGKVSKEVVVYLKQAYTTNEQIISLVNDLLNVSRIEEGRFGYKFIEQKIDPLIKRMITELSNSTLCKSKKIKIELQQKGSLPKVKVDEGRLSMVFQNLIDNAVKYSRNDGLITVGAKVKARNVEIFIKDNGAGIPVVEQKRIYSKFFRGSNALKMETQGTGLGLFIARNIVRAHGGDMSFKSEEGKGTTFIFTLPLSEYFKSKTPKVEFEDFLKHI